MAGAYLMPQAYHQLRNFQDPTQIHSQEFPNSRELAFSLMQRCKEHQDINLGRRLQFLMANNGLDSVPVLANHLIHLFSVCGNFVEATQVFNRVSKPDHFTWNAITDAFVSNHHHKMAFEMYERMQQVHRKPDKYTFLCILKACYNVGAVQNARDTHRKIVEYGLHFDVTVGTSVVNMYAKCGNLFEAYETFSKLPNRNEVSWNVMIAGFVENGQSQIALDCFEKMQHEGIKPSKITFLSTLKACGNTLAIAQGRHIYEQIVGSKSQYDVIIASAVVNMYAKCGSLEEAQMVFDRLPHRNVVLWDVMITGYAQHDETSTALQCFESMLSDGIMPDKVLFLSILKACSSTSTITHGRYIHQQILEKNNESETVVGNALVDMYAKWGTLEEALIVFNKLVKQDVVTWSTMIDGYAEHGEGDLALKCFESMQYTKERPNKVTFLSVLKACGSIGNMVQSRHIHEQVIIYGFHFDIDIGSILVDMYARCGSLNEAYAAFKGLQHQNVVAWNAMLAAYAQLGHVSLAVQCFDDMQLAGGKPNDIAVLSILTAFSHAGLADEGLWYFRIMKEYYGVKMDVSHLTCILDLLGRAGCFQEVYNLLKAVIQADICLWRTLLNACKMHCNVKLARLCFDEIIQLDPSCSAAYILMANIYTHARVDSAVKVGKYAGIQRRSKKTTSKG